MIGLFIGDTYRLSPHSSRRQDVVHKGGNGHHGQAGIDAHEVRSKSWAPHSGGQNCLSFRWIQRGFLLLRGLKRYILGQWCGSVGRATTTSNTRDLQLESSHRQNIILNIGPFLKKNKNIFWYLHSQFFRSYRMPSRAQRCRSKADGIFKLPTCPRSSSHSGDLHEGGWIVSGHRRSTVPHLSGQRRLQHGSRRLQLEFPGQGARRKSKLRLWGSCHGQRKIETSETSSSLEELSSVCTDKKIYLKSSFDLVKVKSSACSSR